MQRPANQGDLRKKIEDYSYGLNDLIGRGSSSVVYRGINDKTKEVVAIKVINLKAIKDTPARAMLHGEIDALKQLNHFNIIRCYDIYSTTNNCYVMTEFCNEGDLENLIKKRGKLSESQAVPIIKDIALGFITIAEGGLLHRDLKPANVMLKDKVAKIGDFGFCKKASGSSKETVNVGTPLYMSPESLRNSIYTIKSDIWSIGVIFYEILHGKTPWESSNQQELLEKISKVPVQVSKNISQPLRDLIKKCLVSSAEQRLSLKEFCEHPFIVKMFQSEIGLKRLGKGSEKVSAKQEISLENFNSKQIVQIHHSKTNPMVEPEYQIRAQFLWMQYLFKLNNFFPDGRQCQRNTLNLRFIVVKQLLGQLQALELAAIGQNVFAIKNWFQWTKDPARLVALTTKVHGFKEKLAEVVKQFEVWTNIVIQDKRMAPIADKNCIRCENLSILGISYSMEECSSLVSSLRRSSVDFNPKSAALLDFLVTYYQLNCFLVDFFYDVSHFARLSKLETIMDVQPVAYEPDIIEELIIKMNALDLKVN